MTRLCVPRRAMNLRPLMSGGMFLLLALWTPRRIVEDAAPAVIFAYGSLCDANPVHSPWPASQNEKIVSLQFIQRPKFLRAG
jgi:hypothetical protein